MVALEHPRTGDILMALTHSARKGHRQWLHEAATLRYEAVGGLPAHLQWSHRGVKSNPWSNPFVLKMKIQRLRKDQLKVPQ